MKIAFFTDTYHPSLDGVVRSIDLFSAQLRRQGHQVRVFAPDGGAAHRRAWARYAPSLPFPPYPQYRVPLWIGDVAAQAADWKPDVIHCHAMLAMGLAARDASRACGAPLVGTFHTMVPSAMHYVTPSKRMQKWAERLSWGYLRWFYRPFGLLIAPSAHLKKEIAGHRLSSIVVPNPVDTGRFRPGRVEKSVARQARARGPVFLYVGRIAEEKNLDYLLKLAATPEWGDGGARLFIAGSGPYKAKLAARARAMGLHGRVRFLGRVPEKQLPSLYRAAEMTLLPSKFETQGLVALESMACGTPVACLEGTALAEVVEPGKSGVRWKEGSGVSEAVRQLMEAMERRRTLSRGARKVAARYSVPACTRQLLGAYQKAIRQKKRE